MPKASRQSASKVVDYGPAEDRTEEFGGYTMNFVSIRQPMDLAPLLKGLPGDSCQCPHWGYLFKGRLTVRYADHEEAIEAGDAFYMPPGHVPGGRGRHRVRPVQPQRRAAGLRGGDGQEHAADAGGLTEPGAFAADLVPQGSAAASHLMFGLVGRQEVAVMAVLSSGSSPCCTANIAAAARLEASILA